MSGDDMAAFRRIYLVSCVSQKLSHPAPAQNLYTSAWFQKARSFVLKSGSPWYILSAEHGLVHPEQVLAPYEKNPDHFQGCRTSRVGQSSSGADGTGFARNRRNNRFCRRPLPRTPRTMVAAPFRQGFRTHAGPSDREAVTVAIEQ